MSRLQRIIADMQYLLTYRSCVVGDDVKDQIVELLNHEEIKHRVDSVDENNWIIDIGTYLLN